MEVYDQKAGRVKVTKVAKGKTTVQILQQEGPIDNIYGFIYRYRVQGGRNREEQFKVRLPILDVSIAGVKEMGFKTTGKAYRAILLHSVAPKILHIWMDKGSGCLPLRIAGAVGLAKTVMTMIAVKPARDRHETRQRR